MRARAAAAVVALGGVLLYRWLGRERVLNWGTEEAEADARLPGDELLEDADVVATRAITVDAPPSAVWPWIAQMGLCVPRIPSMALTSRVAPPSIRS